MKQLFFALFVVVGFYSCTMRDDNTVYTSFQGVDTLRAEVHQVPPVMLYPRGLFLVDSFLVVFNDKMDTCFQVFDRRTLEYQYCFGVHGQGPQDFNMPSGQIVDNCNGEVLVLDFNRLKAINFQQGKPVVSTRTLPAQRSYYNGLLRLNDSVYICEGDHEDNEEYQLIYTDGTVEKKVAYPESSERFGSVLARNQAYGRIAAAHPSGERFASFYTFARRFRIMDEKGKILKDVKLDIAPSDSPIAVEPEERRIHVLAVCATEKHIYTLNLDMTSQEIYARQGRPSIQVFSWEGEPLRLHYLDRFISLFAVDEQARLLYGVFAENENEIYTFPL